MARVTVEDCLNNIGNRFDLVMKATKRARQLAMTGTDPLVPWENDKVTVVALREIASGQLDVETLEPVVAEEAQPEEGQGDKSLPEHPVVAGIQKFEGHSDAGH